MTALVLDPCCGSKMFWFDREDSRVTFGDIRSESHTLCDGRDLQIKPDQIMDFRALPFENERFHFVSFDPPHLRHAGANSWLGKKYGILTKEWREDLRQGFSECFRVLKPYGTLVFKWNETQIKTKDILALTDQKPLIGHPSGARAKTHWISFLKSPTPTTKS